MSGILEVLGTTGIVILVIFLVGFASLVIKTYRKVDQGKALIRNGWGGTKVSFSGAFVIPVLHQAEIMDLSVKRITIERLGKDGLICKDNLRADVKVAFFVKVNKTTEDVKRVAEALGATRASDRQAMIDLFDAKFSEALKTVGKNFDFVELYQARAQFKEEILQIIGTDLNYYKLDDCAIDYLEQTDIENLSADNILDAEGIKKITELTAQQQILANKIDREREKVIKQQNVEAEEAVLELDRQLAESQEKQKREIAAIKAREDASAVKVQQEERLKAETSRLATEEELAIADENKQRQILVAQKNKDRTDAIETERIEKDRLLEVIERERVVELTTIEKERSLEVERKNIQDVIRDRVMVEKAVVEEEEKIKDTKAIADAERLKKVAITEAEQQAEQSRIIAVKASQAKKEAATLEAEQKFIEAEASQRASDKNAEARKVLAEAMASESAANGIAQAQVLEAKAAALEKEGMAKAAVKEQLALAEAKGMEANAVALEKRGIVEAGLIEKKAMAQASGLAARAEALEKQGSAEANNMLKKFQADAQGIEEKAEAMKRFDEAGRDHEEFKLKIEKERKVELEAIAIQKEIADAQAAVIQQALKASKIEIVGGETMFFDKIIGAIGQGRGMDRLVGNSKVLGDVKDTFFNGDPDYFKRQMRQFIDQFGISSEELKNLTTSALLAKMIASSKDEKTKGLLGGILSWVNKQGLGDQSAGIFG